jgi:hypothetical protein
MAITKVTDNMRDTTSLDVSKLSGAVAVAKGGTGLTAVGTSGNVLTSNGSAWASTAPAGGGGIVFLGSATASGSASLDFESLMDGTYDNYKFVLEACIPAADAKLIARISDDNGSSYKATSYGGRAHGYDSAGNLENQSISTGILISGDSTGVDTLGNMGYSGIFYLQHINDGSNYYMQAHGIGTFRGGSASQRTSSQFNSVYGLIDVDAIQFLFDGQNMTSGVIRMYGIVNS